VSGIVVESRVIELPGLGRRSIREMELQYQTKGILNGRADVTLFGIEQALERLREIQS
jgi:hypothetical protein